MGMSLRLQEVHFRIREIPDHATFRGKGVNTGLVKKNLGYVSLWPYVIWRTLPICNFQSIASYTKFNIQNKCMDHYLFPNVNHSGLQVFCTFKKYI